VVVDHKRLGAVGRNLSDRRERRRLIDHHGLPSSGVVVKFAEAVHTGVRPSDDLASEDLRVQSPLAQRLAQGDGVATDGVAVGEDADQLMNGSRLTHGPDLCRRRPSLALCATPSASPDRRRRTTGLAR
jgi:hypothetical protein